MRYVSAKPLFIETPLWPDAQPLHVNPTVDGAKSVNTGLVDAKGNAIYRVQEPVGFHHPKARG